MGAESSIAALVLLAHGLISCGSRFLFMGCPASPFIGEGKARVTAEEKEKEREKKASRIAGSFFSFMRVPLIL